MTSQSWLPRTAETWNRRSCLFWLLVAWGMVSSLCAQTAEPIDPLVRTIDLNVGESQRVTLCDGTHAEVEVLSLLEHCDVVRQAVREAIVTVKVNGKPAQLTSANYHLPTRVGGIQIDCPITSGYLAGSSQGNVWALDKDVRLRVWPDRSPWIRPGTFGYPAQQRWFATLTQMANEPVYVDGGEEPDNPKIYYHNGLDIGGAERLVPIVSATEGTVVSARGEQLEGLGDDHPIRPRGDVVYVRDRRGWYYRYSHLYRIDMAIQPGVQVHVGTPLGLMGKEGASGGWSHLHFGIDCRQPNGRWGATDGYAFLWQAYTDAHQPPLLAVARPHHFATVGQTVVLDASKSWSAQDRITSYTWLLGDRRVSGPRLRRSYDRPGTYSEIVRVRDGSGNVAFDFAVVQVFDPDQPTKLPPTIHPTCWPTSNIHVGDPIKFLVRSFRSGQAPEEIWNFGDGTPETSVRSDGNAVPLAPDGYAPIEHRFLRKGDFLVSVRTTNDLGYTATGHLHIRVD